MYNLPLSIFTKSLLNKWKIYCFKIAYFPIYFRPSVSDAPRANIRPMASPTVSARSMHHTTTPVRSTSTDNRAMASIRPVMAVPQTRTATVMPTTQGTICEHSTLAKYLSNTIHAVTIENVI